MEKTVKKVAGICAVLVLFIMLGAGWFCHGQSDVCAWRGLSGAIVMYAVVRIAGRLITHTLIQAAVENEVNKARQGDSR